MDNLSDSSLDQATSRRLAKLAALPVDLATLKQSIDRQLPKDETRDGTMRIFAWLTPMRAVAASLLFAAVVIAAIIFSTSGPALASPENLYKLHVETTANATKVDSIKEVNHILAGSEMDEPCKMMDMSDKKVMACCRAKLQKKPISCVSIQVDGKPVTVAVAKASDIQCPNCTSVDADGVTYYCMKSRGQTNIVMMTLNEKWVSVIGELPGDQLLALAKSFSK